MNPKIVELVFVAVAVLGIAFWQLWSVNREIRRDREKRTNADREN